MNYTENYHLPQWVKDDRIMMEDFNQMCADIEVGMNSHAESMEQLRQNGNACEKRSLDRFCRLAYNHYQMVKSMSTAPEQIGFFYQNPVKDPTNITGTLEWDGVLMAGSGEKNIDSTEFQKYMEVQSQLKVVKGKPEKCVPLDFTFCAPIYGYLYRFSLRGTLTDNVANTPAPFRLTYTNLDTGEIELTRELDLQVPGAVSTWVNNMIDGPFYFHPGVHYRLRLEALEPVYNAEATLALYDQTPVYTRFNNSSVTASHTFREKTESSGGMLILQCAVGGSKGKLTVTWDGKEIQPTTVWRHTDSHGRRYYEYIYFQDGPIAAESTVALRFDDGGSGDFQFYDWGAILL